MPRDCTNLHLSGLVIKKTRVISVAGFVKSLPSLSAFTEIRFPYTPATVVKRKSSVIVTIIWMQHTAWSLESHLLLIFHCEDGVGEWVNRREVQRFLARHSTPIFYACFTSRRPAIYSRWYFDTLRWIWFWVMNIIFLGASHENFRAALPPECIWKWENRTRTYTLGPLLLI